MAKWDLSKLPEGRKPLDDAWFAERAQMQERIKGLEELLWAAENDANEAEAYAEELEAKLARAVEAGVDVAASLNAAISLLERGGKKAAPSDKMFAQMLVDYSASLDRFRTTLAELTGGKDAWQSPAAGAPHFAVSRAALCAC